jgi:putative tricarboxylic transport membrane protein
MTEIRLQRDVAGLVGCAVAAAIGVAVLAVSGDFSMLGSVFPRTVAALMVAFSLLYAYHALRRPRPAVVQEAGSWPRRIGVAAVMLAWSFALAPVGFLTSSVVACLLLLTIAQHEPWTARTALGYGLAMLVVLYGLFRFALQVPLPVGLFW